MSENNASGKMQSLAIETIGKLGFTDRESFKILEKATQSENGRVADKAKAVLEHLNKPA
jgi:Holliday junction resolvasome RuvABC DNA-binding subunit